jgi:predicted tellurium resistance membrane protein TerC
MDIFQLVVGLVTLTAMEIVLGIDNLVMVAILSSNLPKHQQARARFWGLAGAIVMRVGLLFCISWLMSLTVPWFTLMDHDFTGRDLVLILGGVFLIGKAVHELHNQMEGAHGDGKGPKTYPSLAMTIGQIMVLDIVFSFDSVITAVGMVNQLPVMIASVVIAILIMMAASGAISNFIMKHPTIKVLALSFMVLIGVFLTAEGMGQHIPKGYIYSAMAFAVGVEMLNLRMRKKSGKQEQDKQDPDHKS